MSDFIGENCGIAVAHSLHDVYSMIEALQHRGKDSCGIMAVSDNAIDIIKWIGRVNDFSVRDLQDILQSRVNGYHTFGAHVRYTTSGAPNIWQAHPHFIGGRVFDRGSHMIVRGCEAALIHNGQINPIYLDSVDKSKLVTACDSEALLHYYKNHGARSLQREIPGAYTLAIADKKAKEVLVMRDRTGIRPGVIGIKDGKFCVASEDISFRKSGASFIKQLDPGAIYYFDPTGGYSKEKGLVTRSPKNCFFCWNYVADIESVLEGISVNSLRFALGEQLGLEFIAANPDEQIDFVTFLPHSPEPAAGGFDRAVGKNEFRKVFNKMRDDRSFMGATPESRASSIKKNLYLLSDVEEGCLEGMTGVVIDDSGVRGTNAKHARHLLYDIAKVKKAYYALYTPPIGIIGDDEIPRGCEYGVDMPSRTDNFMARNGAANRTREEISEYIGMPVFYISPQGMFKVFERFGLKRDRLCSFCIGGEKPF